MSGTSHPPRIGLDARAAELKEKLLRGRSQSRSQSQARASPAQPEATPAAVAPNPSTTPSERAKTSSFIPHEMPRLPTATSLPADANDIAALISSISSAADEDFVIPGLNVNGAGSGESKHKPPAQQNLPVNIQPGDVKQKPPAQQAAPLNPRVPASLPPKPTSKVYIPPPTKLSATIQNKPARVPEALSTSPATEALKKEQGRAGNSSPEEDKVTTASTIPPSPFDRLQPPPQSNSRQEHARRDSVPTPTQPPTRSLPRRDSESKPQPAASKQPEPASAKQPGSSGMEKPVPASAKPAELPKTASKTAEAGRASTNGQNKGQNVPKPASKPLLSDEEALARLLSQVPDIKDWLELTDYYNAETRTRKLDRFRRAKALAAERLRIEEEERKLMEEEELEMGLRRTAVVRLTSAVSSAPTFSETGNSLSTPITPTPMVDTTDDTPPVAHPAKRPHDEDGAEAREEKMPRLDTPTPRSEENTNHKPREDDRRSPRPDDRRPSGSEKADARPRAPSPYRRPHPPSPRRNDYRRSSPPPRPREYSPHRQSRHHDDYDDRGRSKYDRYSNDRSYPVRVDLGRDGDTRYFIVKSFNEENVRCCMEDNLWTTQVQNGRILAEAFAKCKNVILFFSINKSRAFQGYARMTSPPSPSTPKPRWVRSIHWDTSDPFRVRWLSTTSVEFFRVGHLKNPLNEGLPVLVGKDGQEIEACCGAELLKEMEIAAAEAGGGGSGGGGDGYYEGRRVSEGSGRERRGGGGYGGKRYVKREESVDRRY